MKMSPSFLEKWETLTEVLEPFSNEPITRDPATTDDIDKALAEIENQLKELVHQWRIHIRTSYGWDLECGFARSTHLQMLVSTKKEMGALVRLARLGCLDI